jgi:hypothetical protein
MIIEYWSLAPRRGAARRQGEHKIYLTGLMAIREHKIYLTGLMAIREHKIYLTGLMAVREGRKPAPTLRTWARRAFLSVPTTRLDKYH